MTRRSHAVHRYRIVSRCVVCGVRLLGTCTYRTCAETTIYPKGCAHVPRKQRRTRHTDLTIEARRIFGDMLTDTLPLGDTP